MNSFLESDASRISSFDFYFGMFLYYVLSQRRDCNSNSICNYYKH